MNGESVKKYWQTFSFFKWVASLVVFTVVNISALSIWANKIESHLLDGTIHLTYSEKSQLDDIEAHGFTFSIEEKMNLRERLSLVEKETSNLVKRLDLYEREGRLQTPSEKIALMKLAMRQLMTENGFTIKK